MVLQSMRQGISRFVVGSVDNWHLRHRTGLIGKMLWRTHDHRVRACGDLETLRVLLHM